MHLSQSRYRVRDLPWKVPPSEEEVSPSAVPPSAGSGVPAESLWPPDWPERHAFPSAPPGSLQRTVVSSSRMKGCIVTQELREICSCPPPIKATRLCSIAELSPESSEPSSYQEPIPLLLTRPADPAELSTSSSSTSNGDTRGTRPAMLPFKRRIIDERVGISKDAPRRLQWFLNLPNGFSNNLAFQSAGQALDEPIVPLKRPSRKGRKRPHVDYPATHANTEGIPLIPSAKVSVGPGAIVPTTNGYRVLDRLPPLDLSGQCVLLLGMVYANEKRRECEGQGMRDTKRIVALEKEFDCRVFTVDKTHPERVGYVTDNVLRHIQSNFNDPRRMLSSFQQAWGKEGRQQFRLVALDYFRSPAGWSETNWSKAFFDHTLPALCTEGWMPDDGRLILPNTTCTMDGIRASEDLQACFNVAVLQDPDDNPLWAATRTLEAHGTLYSMSGHYTNDTERRHLDELAPFIQLTPIPGMSGSKMKRNGD